MGKSKLVGTYPTEQQRERWEEQAEEAGMSMSEFVQSMTEAGMKKFEIAVKPDETNGQLRQQRNELKDELDEKRDRIRTLEDRLHTGERKRIRQFIQKNPGVEYGDIVQHIINTVPSRVTAHLDEMESEGIYTEDGRYYPE